MPPSAAKRRARIYEEALGIKVELPEEEEEHIPEPPREVVELARLYSARGYLRAAIHLLALAQAYAPEDIAETIARSLKLAEDAAKEIDERLSNRIISLGREAQRHPVPA